MKMMLSNHGKTFNSRSLADQIFKVVTAEEIIIDFSGVEEATPSFCHEMLIVLFEKKMKIQIINANESIKLQLNKALSSIKTQAIGV